MMTKAWGGALLAALMLAAPARADGPPPTEPGSGGHGARREAHPGRAGRWGRYPRGGRHLHALPAPPFGPEGPMLVHYREPYLPRGVIYNVPPPPESGRLRALRTLG